MGGCMCFGVFVPTPASKFPGKTYNILVPDIFPITPPRVDGDLSPAVIKKIEKLQEYTSKNPHRASKVSRRLERRIRKEINGKIARLGYVKIAVHAYMYLLAHNKRDDVVLFANELIKENHVIRNLLKHKNVHVRILGAELLAHFLRQQNDGDNLTAIESLVPDVCHNCGEKVPPEITWADDTKQQELKVACLRSLRELVSMMQRLSTIPDHLDIIVASVLDNMYCKPVSPIAGTSSNVLPPSSPRPSSPMQRVFQANRRHQFEQKSTSMDFSFFQRSGMDQDFASASTPSQVSSQVMRELANLTRAPRSAEKVLNSLFMQLDQRHGWQGDEKVKATFDIMRSAFAREHQQFLMFTVVLRHASAAHHLPLPERISLIRLAIQEGFTQDTNFAISVLVYCLANLPYQLPPAVNATLRLNLNASDSASQLQVSTRGTEEEEGKVNDETRKEILRGVILDGIREVAGRVEGAMQLVDNLMGVLFRYSQQIWSEQETHAMGHDLAVLECVLAAAEALSEMKEEAGNLPARKFDEAVQDLVSLLAMLNPQQCVFIYRMLRMVLPLGTHLQALAPSHVLHIYSVIYYGVENAENIPETFAEMSLTFHAVVKQSAKKSLLPGFQLAHTLYAEVYDQSGAARLAMLGPVHRCAILLLASSFVDCLCTAASLTPPENLHAVDECISPALVCNMGLLSAIRPQFPPSMQDKCIEFLSKTPNSPAKLLAGLTKACSSPGSVGSELGSGIQELVSSPFSPEPLDGMQGYPRPLVSKNSTAHSSGNVSDGGDSVATSHAAEWSKRVVQMLGSRSGSWKEGSSAAAPKSVRELFNHRHNSSGLSFDDLTPVADMSPPDSPKPTRKENLASALQLLDDIPDEDDSDDTAAVDFNSLEVEMTAVKPASL